MREETLGRLSMAASALCFASVGGVVKSLGSSISASEKVFWRSLFSVVLTVATNPRKIIYGPLPSRPIKLALRGGLGHFALCAFFTNDMHTGHSLRPAACPA